MKITLAAKSLFLILTVASAWADEPAENIVATPDVNPPAATAPSIESATPASVPATTIEPGTSRALIICGLPGDAEHRKLFGETVDRLYTGLTTHHGFGESNVVVLWSDEATEADGPGVRSSRGVSTRETIISTIAELETSLQPNDRLWVFVLGHAHYDGRYSWLNLPGTDLQHVEFGKLLAGVRCREQAFFITTSASGFYQKSLAAPGRVVITATEPDLEVNETLFPQHLAKTFAEPPAFREMDIDEDGRLTLLDAYLWTSQQTAQEYATNMLIATEHSLLDDSGDGRGTEVQADYLSEELGGRLRAGREKPPIRGGDGALARTIRLAYPPFPPAPEPGTSE
jgi:hypothetical protein